MLNPFSVLMIVLILTMTSTVGAMMGYGMAVIALPFCAFFMDLKMLPPLFGTMGGIASLYISIKERRHINWKELWRILAWCAIGFPVGIYGFHRLPVDKLNIFLGVFIVVVAAHGFWKTYTRRVSRPWNWLFGRALLVLGGVIHGAFTTGGPAVIAYSEPILKDKHEFRATMMLLWGILNPIFVTIYWLSPTRQIEVFWLSLFCLPAIFIGVRTGQFLHHRISERGFRLAVFMLLFLSGLSRFVPNVAPPKAEETSFAEPAAIVQTLD